MATVTGAKVLPQVIGSVAVFLSYMAYFWRIVRKNRGNKLIECGTIAVSVFLGLAFLTRFVDLPDWALGAFLFLLVVLCFTTLGFLVQRIVRSFRHQKPDKPASESVPH